MSDGKFFKSTEVEITHTKGSGPGGQNKNKRMTGVRIVHLATGISILSTERRSQAQNLANALERLDERLKKHFHRPAKRYATKKTRGSNERRHEAKQRSSTIKKFRQRPSSDD